MFLFTEVTDGMRFQARWIDIKAVLEAEETGKAITYEREKSMSKNIKTTLNEDLMKILSPTILTACAGVLFAGCTTTTEFSVIPADPACWEAELQSPENSSILFSDDRIEIDAAGGVTLWFKQKLRGPVIIEYDITVIENGGPNDRVSDMNCFWMFSDPAQPDGSLLFGRNDRNGVFENYHTLQGYYAGIGGWDNTLTRFRKYDGNFDRELRPEHDLSDPQFLIKPNKTYHIQLVADGSKIQYIRDGTVIFNLNDENPYTEGWFGLRTVRNHMVVENIRIKNSHFHTRPR